MTDMLTKDQAAEYLGISRDTLDAVIKSGRLPYYRLGRSIIRIHQQDLVDYVESCRVEASAQVQAKKPNHAPRVCGYIKGMDVV